VDGDRLRPWTPAGYGQDVPRTSVVEVSVLTPPSILRALADGYPVEAHASARALT
jgi:hypothetical protein